MTSLPRLTNRRTALLLVPLLVAGLLLIPRGGGARADITKVVSSVKASDGSTYSITNHLVGLNASGPSTAVASSAQPSGEYLVVWAGDQNIGDASAGSLVQRAQRPEVNPEKLKNIQIPDDAPGNDFLAVIDADKTSSNYGKVVNTVTVGPLVENEPHHVQYIWHKGNKVYAGGLFSDATYVFDVGNLPQVSLSGVNLPTDTPCGSVPDAYWVLHDGTAYGTYMGGADLPGPCLYTNGETRIGNGFAGTPGSLVHLDQNGKTLSEVPAALPTAEDPTRCPGLPTTVASCANPHGIQVREDLGRMITTDYAEPKNVPIDPIKPADSNLFRDTVRIWDITDENNPKVTAVSVMPDGPRHERNPGHEEPRGIMEGTVTNLPNHKGAFSESMCGGVIYYTPDITVANPTWTEVFDDTAASKVLNPHITEGAGCDGGGWLQTSLDDRYLYHAVIGRNEGSLDASDPGVPKMVYTLDVQKLIAAAAPTCNIDTIKEVFDGGAEGDCPTVSGVLELPDGTSGGPHWGALDNFKPLGDGTWGETTDVKRIAVSNYFVARSAVDGNHKVCMVSVGTKGELTLDTSFRDEDHGTPCVDFNRTDWPHGKTGAAKPHSELFIVPNAKLR
jgi:hypothetical protein